jgi:hypothetical protein
LETKSKYNEKMLYMLETLIKEVASQASKAPMFLSSKWNVLMKVWRMTSKGDPPQNVLKECSNNVHKSLKYVSKA